MNFRVKAPPGVCDDVDNPTTCSMPVGTKFALSVEIIDPPASGYSQLETQIAYGGLTYHATTFAIDEVVWPDVLGVNRLPQVPTGSEGHITHFANTSSQAPFVVSHHAGNAVQLSISCTPAVSTNEIVLGNYAEPGNQTGSAVRLDTLSPITPPKAVGQRTVDLGNGPQLVNIGDALEINCANLPTFTPTPPGPSPTPTLTPVPPEEQAGMALTVKDGVCNVVEKPVECHVLVGQTVTLGVVTNDRPAQPYMAVQTLIEIDQLVYKPAPLASDEIIWPDCALPLRFATGSRVAHACGSSLAQPFPPEYVFWQSRQHSGDVPADSGSEPPRTYSLWSDTTHQRFNVSITGHQ